MRKIIILAAAGFMFMANIACADVVKNIAYKGNERISDQTIFAYLELNKNQGFNQEKLDQSIKNLYATGFFSDVKIYYSNGILTVEVAENPMINRIGFDGNKKLDDDDLRQELSLKPRSVLSTSKLDADISRMTSLYHKVGRYSVKIEPKIVKLDQNRVDLVYEIVEGPDSAVKKINFSGNENFSDKELADTIMTKEARWYRFFSSVDVYDHDKMQFDKELLRRFYMNRGFADFAVISASAELSPDKDAFIMTFILHEGLEYNFGEIKVENNIKNFHGEDLGKTVIAKSGDKFRKEKLDDSIEALTTYLGNHGFPFVDIEPVISTNKNTKLADITFIIKESYKVYVNNINIKNNTRTLDKVIRREFRIAEGDPYNISRVQRSKQNIENLGFFNKVEFKNKRTDSSDRMDIDVEVEEASTGSLNFGVGYNTVSGPLGKIVYSESNFLGKGQYISAGVTQAKREQDFTFSFTEPYFMDKKLAVGFDIFTTKSDKRSESSFDSKSVGFVLRSAYNLSEFLTHSVRYSLKRESITNVSDTASRYVKAQKGNNVVSLVGQTFAYDKLDSRLEPSDGYILKVDQDVAGVGGTTQFIRHEGLAAQYFSFYKKELVLNFLGRAGNIYGYGDNHKKVRLNDRFALGPEYIRGFEFGGIGPRDKSTGDALYGNNYVAGTAQLTFPVGLPEELGVKGAVFYDTATLFGIDESDKSGIYTDKSFRSSYGASIMWKSPMGLIKLHYAIPLHKKSFDDTQRIYLNFGTNL